MIGAGIGGLTLGRALARQGIEATLYERQPRYGRTGLGLLLLPNGLAALDAVGLGEQVRDLSNPIDLAVVRRFDGTGLAQHRLTEHRGIARLDLLTVLQAGVSDDAIRWNMPLETITSTSEPVVAQVGGEEVQVDLLVAADGARSTARGIVAPDWRLERCRVSELVSVCDAPDLAALFDRTFIKHVKAGARLAVGLVPAAFGKVVWFVQFDATMWPPVPDDRAGKRAFVQDLVGDFADPIPELIERTDWVHTHLWRTPAPGPSAPLVTDRVVLLGDASHPFPTLTSQGANAAMVDAIVLARHLVETQDVEEALARFAVEREPRLEEIRAGGEKLVDSFVHDNDGRDLPMVL